jgi:SAM-dependent methyltransferase
MQAFARAAVFYHERGWPPIPLPQGKKGPPPDGFTGGSGKDADLEQIQTWITENGYRNIGVRMPRDVIGFDVDNYDSKTGGAELAVVEGKLGELPPTAISTSRDDEVSGIRFFRVPEGLKWPGNLSPSIEIIQRKHRYAVVEPSTHPDTGRQYRWVDADWQALPMPPAVDELPTLPDAWVEHLTGGEVDTGPAPKKATVTAFDTSLVLTYGTPCQVIEKASAEYAARKAVKARHDAMKDTVLILVRHGEQGHQGAGQAVERLRAEFIADIAGSRGGVEGEFQRALSGAVALVLATPTPAADRGCCLQVPPVTPLPPDDESSPPPPTSSSDLILPAEFWARESLREIREYAHSRGASADAVLYANLARISGMVPHQCRLETGIGSPLGAALGLFVAAVGPPGSGKSKSASVAKGVHLPSILDFADGLPLGSGEGIVEAFMGWEERPTGEVYKTKTGDHEKGDPRTKLTRCQVRHNAFIEADEGEAFNKLGSREGSTLGSTLRTAWYGGTVGNQNADPNRRRILPEGSYALGLFIGFQPDTVLPLLRDDAAGTPQRFVYCWTIDPTRPLDVRSGLLPRQFVVRAEKLFLAPSIATEVKQYDYGCGNGTITVPRLDAHRNLTKLKLAALLALLEWRSVVDEEDWRLAGVMWDTSCKVRDHALAAGQVAEAHGRFTRNQHYAEREGMAEVARQRVRDASSSVARVARLIAKHVHNPADPARTIGEVNRRLKSDSGRPYLTEALHCAEGEGWIEVDGDQVTPGLSKPA